MAFVKQVRAARPPQWRAIVTARRALHYSRPDTGGRPASVRAASSLQPFGSGFAIVQDDAGYIALINAQGEVSSVPLPPIGGRRTWSKAEKLDLEASVVSPEGELVMFGSGSTPSRERIVTLSTRGFVALEGAPTFYQRLRAAAGPLNLEGAALRQRRLLLFNRGNDAAGSNLLMEMAWDSFRSPPEVLATAYDLGSVDGVALGFTDGCIAGDEVVFVAVAERTANAVDDGPVLGAVLGCIAPDGGAVCTPILTADGSPFLGKAEGIAPRPGGGWLLVLDPDDEGVPSELCEVDLHRT